MELRPRRPVRSAAAGGQITSCMQRPRAIRRATRCQRAGGARHGDRHGFSRARTAGSHRLRRHRFAQRPTLSMRASPSPRASGQLVEFLGRNTFFTELDRKGHGEMSTSRRGTMRLRFRPVAAFLRRRGPQKFEVQARPDTAGQSGDYAVIRTDARPAGTPPTCIITPTRPKASRHRNTSRDRNSPPGSTCCS